MAPLSYHLSTTQDKALTIIPIVPALLSVLGSTSIILSVARGQAHRRGTYERILLAMSMCDIAMSITLIIQPYMTPKGVYALAAGNDATCRVAGTLFQFSSSSLFYYGSLSYYYLLTIRFGIRKQKLTAWIEPLMHTISIGWPLVTAIVGAALGFYDSLALFQGCWIDNYPKDCSETGETCYAPLISWICSGTPVIFVMFSLIVNNIVIYRKVYNVYHTQRSTVFSGSFGPTQETQDKRLRLLATQAMLYVSAFFATYFCFVLLQILEGNSMGKQAAKLYPIMVLQSLLTPLAGFFNAIVFLRPRYLEIRNHFGSQTIFWAVQRALFGTRVQPVNAMERRLGEHISAPPFGGNDTSRAHETAVDKEEVEETPVRKTADNSLEKDTSTRSMTNQMGQ